MLSPSSPAASAVCDGEAEALHGEGIFRPHVDVADGGAQGDGGEGHALDHAIGVAFHETAVHERPGVAFVAVADDVFLIGFLLRHEPPLAPGRETGAAAAAQAGGFDFRQHELGLLRGERLGQRGIAVVREIVVEAFWINDAAIAQHDLALMAIEAGILQTGGGAGAVVAERQARHRLGRSRTVWATMSAASSGFTRT